ncbi:ABC transporter ATP-binding protein [uncultured Paludibaculum sp.]|uniref:ABC transporter ATP-binding protein n=1 Tax=uncultured Paludibaculum sp. TaxID=1765020 RepID=UPI002AAC1389|nr:ABC transporter ATP-binding protein [uncultured Paludibaculum sp.]
MAIQAERLTKRYGGTEALRGLNLEVPEGSIYAFVGPNGAGKTTAIQTVLNLRQPTSGRAQVLGVDSRSLSHADFQRIGYVSENQRLPEWMKVEEFFAYLRPLYNTWDAGLHDELRRQFDLPARRKLKDLSRGMRMKAALASALVFRPKLLVLDEPFTGLDPLVRDELIQGLLDRAEGMTVFVSSHDLAEIESFASHVGYLEQGRLRLSDEMTVLAERFREVQVVFEGEPQMPSPWPAEWLPAETAGALVRFVDMRHDPPRLRAAFPAARSIEAQPMNLRAIFVALARSGRTGEQS